MRQERCTLLLKTREDSKAPICYYCRSNIAPGEEVISRDNGLYHRNCFKRLFTLTSKCLTCRKVAECLKPKQRKLIYSGFQLARELPKENLGH